jgi:hypothetical protein
MGGRLGSKINQLKDDISPSNNNNPVPKVLPSRILPAQIKPFARGIEEKKDVDHFGEEDLSYVSGDERDFNEQVQELNLQNADSHYKNLQNSRSTASPV